eukprot:TRINITY_DN731_c0_g2_i1.p2 TRINITY_DN731_c0_g2~~TRINITY_DN731_c0_g2_i1.p2  ORF type:complete len:378 (+),score=40.43 TRINITY_DN731_c0_g2_i1:1333-2466(+)
MKYTELIALRHEFETGISTTSDDVFDTLLRYYDGYQFSQDQFQKVFSPYSLLCYLKNAANLKVKITEADKSLVLKKYWYRSGTPTPLMYAAEKYPLSLFSSLQTSGIHHIKRDRVEESCMPEEYPQYPYLQLLQSGYLTIDRYDEQTKKYFLRFPNEEVKDAWENGIKRYRDAMFKSTVVDFINKRDWKEADLEIQNWLKQHTLQMKDNEFFYHSIFFALLRRNMGKRDYCEGKQRLEKNIGEPDAIYGHAIGRTKCIIVPIELKWSGATQEGFADNAVKRNYVSKVQEDKLVKEWKNGKETYYYTIDLVFGEGELKSMRVHEDGAKGNCVYKRDSEDIADMLPEIEKVIDQKEIHVKKNGKQILNSSLLLITLRLI